MGGKVAKELRRVGFKPSMKILSLNDTSRSTPPKLCPYSMRLYLVGVAFWFRGVVSWNRRLPCGFESVFAVPSPLSPWPSLEPLPVAATLAAANDPSPTPGIVPASDDGTTCNVLFPRGKSGENRCHINSVRLDGCGT